MRTSLGTTGERQWDMSEETREIVAWLNSSASDDWRRETFNRPRSSLVTIKDELDDSLMDCDIVGIIWAA
jgi:hypothetical protein